MKKALSIFIVLFMTYVGHAQVKESAPVKTTLDAVMDSIYKKADERGIEFKPLVDYFIRDIHVVDTLEPTENNDEVIGLTKSILGSRKSDIYVLSSMFDDFYNAERVIIHEIGHAMWLDHCCKDKYCANIMTPKQATNPEHIMYQIAYLTVEYGRTFDTYFDKIRERHCKDGSHRYRTEN